jgi:deoxyribose-phosphate aldolase
VLSAREVAAGRGRPEPMAEEATRVMRLAAPAEQDAVADLTSEQDVAAAEDAAAEDAAAEIDMVHPIPRVFSVPPTGLCNFA